jgi:hypothetical protein
LKLEPQMKMTIVPSLCSPVPFDFAFSTYS